LNEETSRIGATGTGSARVTDAKVLTIATTIRRNALCAM